MKKVRAGIIGLGVGEKHIDGYLRHPECEVVALCDLDEEKLNAVRTKYPGIKTVKDADLILNDPEINAVSIASYDNYHFEQIERAISNNKHVFVEKPVCLFEAEAQKIRIMLDQKPGIKISSNLILRMSPRFRLIKDKIEKSEFGELFYIEGDYNYGRVQKITEGWRGKIPYYSIVLGGAIHVIDLILWMTKDRVTEVSACGNKIVTRGTAFKYNDLVTATLKFSSGMIAKVSANFGCVSPHFHALSIYGTKETFINGMPDGILYRSREWDSAEAVTAQYPGVHKGDLILSFVESIISGGNPDVSKDEIFESMSVCFAVEQSVRSGKWVKVKYI